MASGKRFGQVKPSASTTQPVSGWPTDRIRQRMAAITTEVVRLADTIYAEEQAKRAEEVREVESLGGGEHSGPATPTEEQ